MTDTPTHSTGSGQDAERISEVASRLRENVQRVIVGATGAIDLAIVALLCRGHVLVEDVPGIGKTTLSKVLAQSMGCTFRRIQFTPDLMPSDVLGVNFFNQKVSEFEFRPGPVFSQVLLADEINRATPRTQSALLEAMQERQSTIDGETYPLPEPFLVIATQNPLEMEGTFPLPEAQLDRFMVRIRLGYPTPDEEAAILQRFERSTADPSVEPVTDERRAAGDAGAGDEHPRGPERALVHRRGGAGHAGAQRAVAGRQSARGAGAVQVLPGERGAGGTRLRVAGRREGAGLAGAGAPYAHHVQLAAAGTHRGPRGRGDPGHGGRPHREVGPLLVRLWHDLWIGLFLILIVVGVFSGQGILIGFAAMGLLVAGVSWLWDRMALEDVTYERTLSQNRVFMGEEVTLTVAVTNGKPVPLARLSVQDTIPLEVEVLDAETSGSSSPNSQTLRHLTSMAWYERIRWDYKIKSAHRGLHMLGPAQVESGDLFGFFSSEKSFLREGLPAGVSHGGAAGRAGVSGVAAAG